MKKIFFLLTLIFLLLNFNFVKADENIKTVVVTGSGLTEQDALKDLSRVAVEQVVGIYVLSNTIVKNYQVIKDNIYTHSNGFVKSFKVINKTKESGIYKIEAIVDVEVGNLTSTLKKINITTKEVGTNELKIASLSKLDFSQDFKKVIEEVIFNPIKFNKKIYDINIVEFSNSDNVNLNKVKWVGNDKVLLQNGKLLPFKLKFSIGLNEDYIQSVRDFLGKSSIKIHESYPKISKDKNNNFILFKKIQENERSANFMFDKEYEFSFTNSQILSKLALDLDRNYIPNLTISFIDQKKKVYKKLLFSKKNYAFNFESQYSNVSSSEFFLSEPYSEYNTSNSKDSIILGFDIYGFNNDLAFFVPENKEVELVVFLTKDNIDKLKDLSIELNFIKK